MDALEQYQRQQRIHELIGLIDRYAGEYEQLVGGKMGSVELPKSGHSLLMKRARHGPSEGDVEFRGSVEAVPLAIADVTAEGEMLYANRAFREMLTKVGPREVAPGEWMQMIPEEQRGWLRKRLKELRGSEEAVKLGEIRLAPAEGREMVMEVIGAAVARDEGEGAIQILFRDVTVERTQREGLEHQNEMMEGIFNNIPIMLSLRDAEGRHLQVNRYWQQVMGWSRDEVVGRDMVEELYPDEERRAEVEEFVRRGKAEWAVFRPRTRGGEEIETRWATVRLSQGRTIGIGQDVTEEARRGEAMRRLLEQQEATLEALPVNLALLDGKGKILEVNQGWREFAEQNSLLRAITGRGRTTLTRAGSRRETRNRNWRRRRLRGSWGCWRGEMSGSRWSIRAMRRPRSVGTGWWRPR